METKENHENNSLYFSEGMVIDIEEGWRKLISRQFGGNPGRAFGELIQNLLDSYPSHTAWKDRRGDITSKGKTISITDYGEGLSRERLKLISRLGGTDKQDDTEKIGQFGIGFFSIFNPKLGTEQVKVTTMCEGSAVELLFKVEDPEKRPLISTKILEGEISFSTKIEVVFNKKDSVEKCLKYAEKALRYYPCYVRVNGDDYLSVWSTANESGAYIFREGSCHGILMPGSYSDCMKLLCKYEYITDSTFGVLATGGHDTQWDLRDYYKGELPVLPNLKVIINCNDLILTISRDSFFLGQAYERMIQKLSKHLLLYLDLHIHSETDPEIILANQYTLRKRIKAYIKKKIKDPESLRNEEDIVLKKLAEAKVYNLIGHKDMFSLWDIYTKKSPDKPLFFSPGQNNLHWLGGAFKHDFTVIPKRVSLWNGAPNFYDELFDEIFEDTVNLDTITYDTKKIKELVKRNIVDKSALSPNCKFIGQRKLTQLEKIFIEEMDKLLENNALKRVISQNILLPIKNIKTAFFELDQENKIISAGLFNKSGKALNEFSNITEEKDETRSQHIVKPLDLTLGIRRDHPVVVYLLQSQDVHRVYYTLTFLAHELSLCQKLLIPYSSFYHMVRERLSADMRKALIENLVAEGQPQNDSKAA